ncbi:lipoprotein BA_5634 family protein [Planococcus sp. YIM B11945]|uniref:lipoprotein BA_5634 family protein n=1 Tax=Planococcus sp. YIM B11945 TaxID=3435410 RepID=UPI003D7C946B
MKKKLLGFTAALMASVLLTGCGLFEKANGIILYGDEQKILESLKQEPKGEKEKFSIKVVETENERMMVINEETAQALVDKELLKKVMDNDKTKAISSLPKVAKGESILYAKKEKDGLVLEGQTLKTTYEGNSIIGDGRAYVDMFLIVDNEDWPAIEGAEKTMGIIQYKKDPDGMKDFDVERAQLVRIVD